jgi:hypothetical protein
MGGLLSGKLAYVFLVAILDAAVISWIALRWYRRSVLRLMRERGTPSRAAAAVETAAQQAPPSTPAASLEPLTVALFDVEGSAQSRLSHQAGMGRRRLSIAYGIGAALYSAVITYLFFLSFDTWPPLAAWFAQWLVFAWPIVPTLAVVLVLDRYEVIRLAAGYVVIGGIATATVTLALQVLRGSFNDAPLTNVFWFVASLAFAAALPLALLVITGWRRIRAVTPLALSSTLVFGFALVLFREAVSEAFNLDAVRSVLLQMSALTNEHVMYYGVFMILVLPVGWVAWRLLQYLAARYERKRFSDVQLIVDCWWLIVTADHIATHLSTNYGFRGIAAGIAAFAVYRISVALALSWQPGPQRSDPKRRLLLLRVFGYQARTETLFDRVAQQWRFHGPVQMIAGVDLATRTADPGDMLAFVGGRLDERYVATPDEAGHRVGGLDMQPDPDGRFRVNEVYCHDDTWRSTLQALLDTNDIVLMDLRGFSSVNAGCVFELEQLVSRLAPEKIVFVYDQTTDLRLLGNCLGDGWQRGGHGGAAGGGPISCVRVERNSWPELQLLMRRLLGQEQPHRVLGVADLASA